MKTPSSLRALILAGSFAALLVPQLSAQVTVTYTNGQSNPTNYVTTAPNDPITLAMADGSAEQSGGLSGTGAIIKSGEGMLTLYGAPTYTGGTFINEGTLLLFAANNFAPDGILYDIGEVTVASGATLVGYRANLAGPTLTLQGGTWQEDNGFGGAWTGAVVLGATSLISSDYGQTIHGNVSGAGGLNKNGSGMLTLTGTNTYNGPTTVIGGVLRVASSLYGNVEAQWTPANITVASGATLLVSIGGAGEFTGAQAGTLFANLSTVNNNGLRAGATIGYDTTNSTGTITVSATLTDSTGPGGGAVGFRKNGPGTLALIGANTYSGQTILEAVAGEDGTLIVSSFNSVSSPVASSSLGRPTNEADGTIRIGIETYSGGNLVYTGTGETTDRVIEWGGYGSLRLDQSGTGLLKFTSPWVIGDSEDGIFLEGSTAGRGEIAGSIPNSVNLSLTKAGTGNWTLSGENFHPGSTTISGGTLVAAHAAALGTTDAGTMVESGATLDVQAHIGTEGITVEGTGVGGHGALITSATFTGTIGGTVALTAATTLGGAGDLTINGAVTGGADVIKVGGGVTTFGAGGSLAGVNDLTAQAGTTNVNSVLGTGVANTTVSDVRVTGAGTKLRFGTVSQTLSSLTIGAGATVTFTSGAAGGAFSGGGKSANLGGSAVVPEPGTFGLLLVGALGLLGRRRTMGPCRHSSSRGTASSKVRC